MAAFIGAWSAQRHLRQLDDLDYRYYVVRDATGTVDGFAIVFAYNAHFRWYELARLAMREPGDGRGSDVLRAVIDATFERDDAHRIQLDVYADNVRARRAYARAGFREEGVMRAAVTRDGRWTDLVLMALLENERLPATPAVEVARTTPERYR